MSSTFLGFSTTAASNTQVNGIGIQGTNQVLNFDDAFRNMLAIFRRDIDGRMVLSTKSTNYTVVANDNNAVIRFSAAATCSLTAAATLGAGHHFWLMADGGAVVIDPNSTETINGASTITIPDGYSTLVICDGTNFRALEDYATVSAALSALTSSIAAKQDNSGELYRSILSGLTLSNNATDANNDIDIATGSAGSDGTTPVLMTLSSAITKRLDATWTVGTNNGGLDTGTKAINTWYHVWLIQRSDTGVVDVIFSTSVTSPTMPANYDRKRRIGAVQTNGSGNIHPFVQVGDHFQWVQARNDISTTGLGTSATTSPISVPAGIKTLAVIEGIVTNASGQVSVWVSSPDETDDAPSVTLPTTATLASAAGNFATFGKLLRTDTSSQIRYRANLTSTTLRIRTSSYFDYRGKN